MMLEILLVFLLPLAAWIGWRSARISARHGEKRRSRQLSNRYFQGLNYLLNEQPDKAIRLFTQMAEVNRDTVETHLALGSLFRRRGEVDRAIRLHQNIISKRNLDENQRTAALLELGEDYMRAGLFDRAEKLFGELVERNIQAPSALRNLLDIYQQEKEWEQALEIARRLEKIEPAPLGSSMSHFCCELAEAALSNGNQEAARKYVGQARRHDPESVRAELIAARIASSVGNAAAAMDHYERVAELDSDTLHDIITPYFEAAEAGGHIKRAREQLAAWSEHYDGVTVMLKQASFIEQEQGKAAAAEYLGSHLSDRPSLRGLKRLLELRDVVPSAAKAAEQVLVSVTDGLLKSQSVYRCSHCGFSGHQHHWQCPSCRAWGTTRVIRGVLGE
jgi:lipopolysaccharide biosynthesis regulator YciM